MAGPKLDRPRKRVAKLLIDACLITHQPRGRTNATVDPVTLAIADDVPAQVYAGGCLVRSLSRPRAMANGTYATYLALLPWDVSAPTIGDTFTLTTTTDPFLLGEPMTVQGVESSSFPVVRHVYLTMAVAAQPTPES